MEFWCAAAHDEELRLPAATAAVSFIDARDIAAVGVRILAGTAADGECDLIGPQALTFDDIGQAGAASAESIHAGESLTDSELQSAVLGLGLDETYVPPRTTIRLSPPQLKIPLVRLNVFAVANCFLSHRKYCGPKELIDVDTLRTCVRLG